MKYVLMTMVSALIGGVCGHGIYMATIGPKKGRIAMGIFSGIIMAIISFCAGIS